uniref:Uncharacterized protein n=1 Tax=Physcomitrium patens TaxID=3218 RepID=A0A2K1KGU2_PHYPA|nr:hypothetical protein PHYPA_009376 [Physcomitrium patens]
MTSTEFPLVDESNSNASSIRATTLDCVPPMTPYDCGLIANKVAITDVAKPKNPNKKRWYLVAVFVQRQDCCAIRMPDCSTEFHYHQICYSVPSWLGSLVAISATSVSFLSCGYRGGESSAPFPFEKCCGVFFDTEVLQC